MSRRFAEITFTPSVIKAQQKYGSRSVYAGLENHDQTPDLIGPREREFIEERDGFYQATVTVDGWPYVQFKGGAKGFLKVLDERTLGYADFRGNVQYLSVGNVADNDRVALILMDYPNQRRLKVWARVRLVDYKDDPSLVESLEIQSYRVQGERAFLLTVEALDWNCPKFITPRYTKAEVEAELQPLLHKLAAYEEAEAKQTQTVAPPQGPIGTGPLTLEITGVRQLTDDIRAYDLRRPDREDVQAVAPGTTLEIPVQLPDGSVETRHYSISNSPDRRSGYEIAVKKEPQGTGGSKAVHDTFQLGMTLNTRLIEGQFNLHKDDRPAVLIAGGIGITPLKAMAHKLSKQGRAYHLHYAAKTHRDLAYKTQLDEWLEGHVSYYTSANNKRLDVVETMKAAAKDSVFYVCGPARLITAVQETAKELGLSADQIQFEHFSAPLDQGDNNAFVVWLEKSNRKIFVSEDQTLLDALLAEGVDVPFGCKAGTCGACETKVVDGDVDHRDVVLSENERTEEKMMCPCVSRAKGDSLTLDL